jgi:hypothetical protein
LTRVKSVSVIDFQPGPEVTARSAFNLMVLEVKDFSCDGAVVTNRMKKLSVMQVVFDISKWGLSRGTVEFEGNVLLYK